MKVTVFGCGGWGIAVARHLHGNGSDVTLWTPFEEECAALRNQRGNEKLLPGIRLDDAISFTCDIRQAAQCDMGVIAVPSFAVHETALRLRDLLPAGRPVVLLSKGFDREGGNCLLSETLERALAGRAPVVAVTGPSHAEEVARGIPTAVVAASRDAQAAKEVQDVFAGPSFRVYTSPDIVGAELGGAMKNIMALAVGISDGAGFGDNTKAMIMTRGIAEMSRFGVLLGGKAETFAGLSGIGDLIVTCVSQHSRNRRAGLLIGAGKSPEQAIKEVGAVVEGYYAVQSVHELQRTVPAELPITDAIYRLLFEGAGLDEVVKSLLSREKRCELEPWLVERPGGGTDAVSGA